MVFLELFWVFFKQGLLGFGGGYAMLSLMQHDVVESHAWIDHQQFADIVALSQMTPGPICINAATYVGYNAAFDAYGSVGMGIAGSLLASIAVCLPSLFVIWVVMAFLLKHRNNPVVGGVVDSFKLISVALDDEPLQLHRSREHPHFPRRVRPLLLETIQPHPVHTALRPGRIPRLLLISFGEPKGFSALQPR